MDSKPHWSDLSAREFLFLMGIIGIGLWGVCTNLAYRRSDVYRAVPIDFQYLHLNSGDNYKDLVASYRMDERQFNVIFMGSEEGLIPLSTWVKQQEREYEIIDWEEEIEREIKSLEPGHNSKS